MTLYTVTITWTDAVSVDSNKPNPKSPQKVEYDTECNSRKKQNLYMKYHHHPQEALAEYTEEH